MVATAVLVDAYFTATHIDTLYQRRIDYKLIFLFCYIKFNHSVENTQWPQTYFIFRLFR